MPSATTMRRTGRGPVTDEVFACLARRVMAEDGVSAAMAERVVDQALAFLATCAANPGAQLAPSRSVDVGWHAFILHTEEYADFCHRVAGHFIHHRPLNAAAAGAQCHPCHEQGCSASGKDGDENTGTRITRNQSVPALMAAAGFDVDAELWTDTPWGA